MKKILLAIGVICSIFLLVLGGCSMQGKPKKETEKEKLVKIVKSKEAKAVFDEWMKNTDPKAFTVEGKIKSYKIEYDKAKENPMGGIMVPLIINDNSKLKVTIHILVDASTGKLKGGGSVENKEIEELIGE